MNPVGRVLLAAALVGLGVSLRGNGAFASEPAQIPEPSFGLPFGDPPGPDTWLLVQGYGNTIFAYRNRRSVYGAGQGLHFGVDLAARCGTPVLAIGDGTVSKVDSIYHGAGPHNLMIDHGNGLASFYGHLLLRPTLEAGQPVHRGEVVAYSGDPDESCASRPHLHLEIRNSPGNNIAYNPMVFIDGDWNRIALVGAASWSFEKNLAAPERWQSLLDQPDTHFGSNLINDYAAPWPPDW